MKNWIEKVGLRTSFKNFLTLVIVIFISVYLTYVVAVTSLTTWLQVAFIWGYFVIMSFLIRFWYKSRISKMIIKSGHSNNKSDLIHSSESRSIKIIKFIFLLLFSLTLFLYLKDRLLPNVYEEMEVKIVAANQKSEISSGKEVWIQNIKIGAKNADLSGLENELWNYQDESQCLVANPVDKQYSFTLDAGRVKTLSIDFIKHQWSGKVSIVINGKTYHVDLYSQDGTNYVFQYDNDIVTLPFVYAFPLYIGALLLILVICNALLKLVRIERFFTKFVKTSISLKILILISAALITLSNVDNLVNRNTSREVTITAFGEKNEKSLSSEVWIVELNVNGKKLAMEKYSSNENWENRDGWLVSYKNQPNHLKFSFSNRESAKISFLMHNWSGIVQIDDGHTVKEIDLYSHEGGKFEYEVNEYLQPISNIDVLLKLLGIFMICVLGIFIVIQIVIMKGIWDYLVQISMNSQTTVIAYAIFSALFSAAIVVGNKVNNGVFVDFHIRDFVNWLVVGISTFFVLLIILRSKFTEGTYRETNRKSKKYWLIVFVILCVCWLPYLFVYYPGTLSPDSYSSIQQALGTMKLNNHHPVAFTLIVKMCLKIGQLFNNDLRTGIAVFSLVQMFIVSSILSYCIYWLKCKGISKKISILCICFFALNPIIAKYSMTMWKDILFSAVVLLDIMLLYDIIESNGKELESIKGCIKFIVINFILCFLRNNGLYILVISLVSLIVVLRNHRKTVMINMLIILLPVLAIQGPVFKMLDINKSGFAESVGIPLQQIGYTIKYNGEVTQENLDFLENMIPIETMKKAYTPYLSDGIKFHPEFNSYYLDKNKAEFLKTWAIMLPKNLPSYIKAYCMQTLGYWHIGTTNWVVLGDAMEQGAVPITDYLGKVFNLDIRRMLDRYYDVTNRLNFYSISLTVWLLALFIIIKIKNKSSRDVIPVVPLIALWLTIMIATPTFCEFRYMYAFYISIPFMCCTLLLKKRIND